MRVMILSCIKKHNSLEKINEQNNFISNTYHQEDKIRIVQEGDFGEGRKMLIWIRWSGKASLMR